MPPGAGVPAAPNESWIRGRIVSVRPAPGGVGAVWEIELTESRAEGSMHDLARSRVGTGITVYVHPGLRLHPRTGMTVEARVRFQGDETGGAFFVMGQDARVVHDSSGA